LRHVRSLADEADLRVRAVAERLFDEPPQRHSQVCWVRSTVRPVPLQISGLRRLERAFWSGPM